MNKTQFKIKKPIRLIELFAGIGSQAMALKALGANFETYKVIEFDKFAIKSYNAIHGTNFPTLDIINTKGKDLEIKDTDKYEYIMTYSFPCQDLSIAGSQKGMKKGSGTRSGLLWEVERILNELEELPQVLLMENVAQVHNKNNIDDFNLWIKFLESKGYKNYWKDLNSKNYGVAQNRNRCFMVSLLSKETYTFPKEIKLTKNINNYLQNSVEEKYYIKNEKSEKLLKELSENTEIKGNTFLGRARSDYGKEIRKEYEKHNIQVKRKDYTTLKPTKENISTTIQTSNTDKLVLCYMNYRKIFKVNCDIGKTLAARDYKGYGTGFDTMNGIIEKVNNPDPKLVGGFGEKNYGKQYKQGNRVYSGEAVATALTSSPVGHLGGYTPLYYVKEKQNYRIRKLTPLECWRLMGFSDTDFYKAQAVNSNTQLYKQAGNSIVKDVLMAIFKEML